MSKLAKKIHEVDKFMPGVTCRGTKYLVMTADYEASSTLTARLAN